MTLYSTSDEERDTILSFLLFKEINEFPKRVQYSVVDRLVTGQVAQFESLYASMWMEEEAG
jgi:hypothetical protein